MHASGKPHDGGRGVDVLLHHCNALDRAGEERPSAFERLADAVGHDLARMLVSALVGERGARATRLFAA